MIASTANEYPFVTTPRRARQRPARILLVGIVTNPYEKKGSRYGKQETEHTAKVLGIRGRKAAIDYILNMELPQIKEVFIMVDSISKQEIQDAVEKAKDYFSPILAPKTVSYYTSVWDKLLVYADNSPDRLKVDIRDFYELVTYAPAYTRPETSWLRTQARAVLSLLDIHEGNTPKREYYYKTRIYDGVFQNELNAYLESRIAAGKKSETLRSETILVADFLIAMENLGISALADVTAEDLVKFLDGM